MGNPKTLATLETQDTGLWQTNQNTPHRQLERWTRRTPPKTGDVQVLTKGKPFLPLIRHPSCYYCSQDVFAITM